MTFVLQFIALEIRYMCLNLHIYIIYTYPHVVIYIYTVYMCCLLYLYCLSLLHISDSLCWVPIRKVGMHVYEALHFSFSPFPP